MDMWHVWGGGLDMYTGFWWGNLRERDQFGRPPFMWEGNVKMDLQEVVYGVMDWIHLGDRNRWRALVNAVMNLWVP